MTLGQPMACQGCRPPLTGNNNSVLNYNSLAQQAHNTHGLVKPNYTLGTTHAHIWRYSLGCCSLRLQRAEL